MIPRVAHQRQPMVDSIITSSYAAVAIIGLIHGLEPGHGWPVAALLSLKRNRPLLYGFASSSILSAAHFLSSVAVLLVYYLAAAFIDFTSPYFRYLVAAVLLILAIRFFTEKAGDGTGQSAGGRRSDVMTLKGLATFAIILGFAHEEEFMLLALAVGGVNPIILISTYAFTVTISLVGITLASIGAYSVVEERMKRYERHIPKVTGLVLTALAVLFLTGVY